mmetsp:Transcript_42556/g.56164  ORF Transcript_42556/g.56164 Transcript_42556/m.56164 type:complete len:224 (+) Transcript_42556:818-1489(+)
MRRLRMTQATVNALTSFNQRRLLEAQVEASFLLRPFGGDNKDGEGKKGGSGGSSAAQRRKKFMGISSSEESVEDFAFLEETLKDTKDLDETSRKLLNGIIQMPPKDMKRLDKLSKQELWERRRAKALAKGIELSDEYDSELDGDPYGTVDHNKNSGILEAPKMRQSGVKNSARVHPEVNVEPISLEIQHPECPEGFDPARWDKMSLEAKCKYLGIDINEWIRN